MKKVIHLVLIVATLSCPVLLASGCGAEWSVPDVPVPPSGTSEQSEYAGDGFLFVDRAAAMFFQWSETESLIIGSAQLSRLSSDSPEQKLSTDTYDVSGRRDGENISLSLSLQGLPVRNLVGTIDDEQLVLYMQEDDGSLVPVTFYPATTADFNEALNGLRTQVDSDNQAAQDAINLKNQESAIDELVQLVKEGLLHLDERIKEMQSVVRDLAQGLEPIKDEVDQIASEAQAVLEKAKKFPDGNGGEVVGDASSLKGRMASLAAEATYFASGAASIENTISVSSMFGKSIREIIQTLRENLARLTQLQTALPSYKTSAISAAAVNAAITSAEAAIAEAVAETNKHIDRVNSYVTEAYKDVVAACRAAGAAEPSQREPLAHIPS